MLISYYITLKLGKNNMSKLAHNISNQQELIENIAFYIYCESSKQYSKSEIAFAEVRRLVETEGVNINYDEYKQYGRTPLLEALRSENFDFISYFLNNGADINYLNSHNTTPLIEAIKRDSESSAVIDLLIKNGADVNLADVDNATPIIWAVRRENLENIKRLLEEPINLDCAYKDYSKKISLEMLVKKSSFEVKSLFKEKGLFAKKEDIETVNFNHHNKIIYDYSKIREDNFEDKIKFINDFIIKSEKLQNLISDATIKGNIKVKFLPSEEMSWISLWRPEERIINLQGDEEDLLQIIKLLVYELCNAANPLFLNLNMNDYGNAQDYAIAMEIAEYATYVKSYEILQAYLDDNAPYIDDLVEKGLTSNKVCNSIKEKIVSLEGYLRAANYAQHTQIYRNLWKAENAHHKTQSSESNVNQQNLILNEENNITDDHYEIKLSGTSIAD